MTKRLTLGGFLFGGLIAVVVPALLAGANAAFASNVDPGGGGYQHCTRYAPVNNEPDVYCYFSGWMMSRNAGVIYTTQGWAKRDANEFETVDDVGYEMCLFNQSYICYGDTYLDGYDSFAFVGRGSLEEYAGAYCSVAPVPGNDAYGRCTTFWHY